MKPTKLDGLFRRIDAVREDSPDLETKVGALLVDPNSGAVLSSGYNGFVRGANDSILPKTRPEKYPFMIHAETNLILNCARHGISTEGKHLVCSHSPCVNCLRFAYQCGISTTYFREKYRDFEVNCQMEDLLVLTSNFGKYFRIKVMPNG